mmetsp:Transcript_2785/g.11418  ORF Transcript_2785/g.11418 Transcript_2785/m.11418 type:complete len:394 (+) Transcript_2785:468-1649(+)
MQGVAQKAAFPEQLPHDDGGDRLDCIADPHQGLLGRDPEISDSLASRWGRRLYEPLEMRMAKMRLHRLLETCHQISRLLQRLGHVDRVDAVHHEAFEDVCTPGHPRSPGRQALDVALRQDEPHVAVVGEDPLLKLRQNLVEDGGAQSGPGIMKVWHVKMLPRREAVPEAAGVRGASNCETEDIVSPPVRKHGQSHASFAGLLGGSPLRHDRPTGQALVEKRNSGQHVHIPGRHVLQYPAKILLLQGRVRWILSGSVRRRSRRLSLPPLLEVVQPRISESEAVGQHDLLANLLCFLNDLFVRLRRLCIQPARKCVVEVLDAGFPRFFLALLVVVRFVIALQRLRAALFHVGHRAGGNGEAVVLLDVIHDHPPRRLEATAARILLAPFQHMVLLL